MRLAIYIILSIISIAFKQSEFDKIPPVVVKTLNGTSFSTANISNEGKPIIICFWATWCRSSIKELDAIAEVYDDWRKETGVKLIAVSFDDSRSSAKVSAMVSVKDWSYEVLLDINQDFKRAMNVNVCPHTILVSNKGKIAWQSTSYLQGSEDKLFELIKLLARNQEIEKN